MIVHLLDVDDGCVDDRKEQFFYYILSAPLAFHLLDTDTLRAIFWPRYGSTLLLQRMLSLAEEGADTNLPITLPRSDFVGPVCLRTGSVQAGTLQPKQITSRERSRRT